MKVITLFLLFFLFYSAKGQTIVLNKNIEKKIESGFLMFQDTSKNLVVEKAAEIYRSKSFRGNVNNLVEKGNQVFWLYFSLENKAGFDGEWVLDFQNWSYVEAYIKKGNRFTLHKTGHLLPFRERDYPVANKAYILIPLKDKEKHEFFVRLESTNNNDLVPDKPGFKIAPRSAIDRQNRMNSTIIFSFLAVLFVIFFYNLFIYVATRLQSYLFYLAVIVFTFYHTAYNSGYLLELLSFYQSLPAFLVHFEKFSSILYGIFIILFASNFLSVKSRYPTWNKIIKLIIYSFLASAVLVFIHEETGKIVSAFVALATIICIMILAIKSTIERYPAAEYFLVGYSFFLISSIVLILALMQVIDRNDWTVTYSLPLGSTLEIIFFSFALANLINDLRRKNNENERRQREYILEKENREAQFQRELLKTQLEIQEQTFQAISEEIHDNIGQKLILTKLNVNTINLESQEEAREKLTECRNLLSETIQDLRHLSKTLNTEYIDEVGLAVAIERQLEIIRKTGLLKIEVDIKGEQYKIGQQHELVIFRVVQELLNNILKHARASSIRFTADYHPDKLLIELEDDGIGFEHLSARKDPGGLGLRNVEHRIRLIKGSIDFQSKPGMGTMVKIEIPRTL